jgi:hypothetical protein
MSQLNKAALTEARLPEKFCKLVAKEKYIGSQQAIIATGHYVKKYLDPKRKTNGVSLCLIGPEFSGKTYLLVHALMTALSAGKDVMYINLPDLFESAFYKSDYDLWAICKNTEFLGIDNIEKMFYGLDYQKHIFRLFLKARIDRGLPTIISLSSDQTASLKDSWGNEFVQLLDSYFAQVRTNATSTSSLRSKISDATGDVVCA